MDDVLVGFSGRTVLVLGDVMLDEFIWGEVHRLSPEAPVPVVDVRRRAVCPGGAGNAAANVASLGGRVLLGGVLGKDEPARRLREALTERGVEAEGLVEEEGRRTTTKTRVLAHGHQVVRLDSEETHSIGPGIENALLGWLAAHIEKCDALILSDYGKGVVTRKLAEGAMALARKATRPVIVDPKGTDYGKYRGATVVTPNLQEAGMVLHVALEDEQDVLDAGKQLVGLLEGSAVLLTRGFAGMSLFEPGGAVIHVPAVTRSVFDVTGAGDTVVGVLALGLASGLPLIDAARLANRAAGIVVGRVGTATVSLEELRSECDETR